MSNMDLTGWHSLAERPKKNIHLSIGQVFACREPAILQTLLGSCVSTCLFDPATHVCGMNHILLPGKADLNSFNDTARYGINAMEVLINELAKLGALRSRLRAKVFGGGHVLASVAADRGPGQRNVEFVLEYLRLENIRVEGKDVGGPWTRVIQFHSDTFEVFVRKVRSSPGKAVELDEERFERQVAREVSEDTNVTLFD